MADLPNVKRSDVTAAPIWTSRHRIAVAGMNLKISANRMVIKPKEKTKFIDPKRRTPIGGKLLANLSAADKKAVTTNEASRRNPVATTRPREKSLPDSSCPEALCRVIHLPDCVESILKFIEGP